MPLLPKSPPLSRRTLLRGLGGSAALGALGTVAGCGVPAAYVAPGDRAATDRSAGERRLTWANWPLYIDTDDEHPSRRPTLEAFEKETGISVGYVEEINDNDEFFGKISPSLMNHQPTDRDLIVISDWMCGRFVRLGWVQEMDRSRQPNVTEYLDPLLRSPAFDPGRRFTVPWQSGITGIAYNRRRLGREIRHVSDLWAADLKGRVTLLSGMDEAFALLMQGNGVDITDWKTDDFHRICDQVEKQVAKGQIRRFTGNDYIKDLSSGDVLACQGLLRRRDPAPGRRPGHRVRRPRGGRRAVGGVPDDPQPGPPQGQRRAADRLLLPPRGRRRAGRLGQLRLPGPRSPGRARLLRRRGDRRPGRGPADLPGRADAGTARHRAGHPGGTAHGVREAVERDRRRVAD
ncbi:spermidine/putrescine-binding protein [Streptomyces ambofaciens]